MKKKIYLLLLLPSFLLITIFMIFPLITLVYPTFLEGDFAFSSYINFFSDQINQKIIMRTIRVSLISTLVCMLLGIPTAFFISRSNKKTKEILSAIILFPLLTNGVIRAFAWMNMLGKNGVINSFLLKISLIKEPIQMMYTEFAIIVGSVYLFLPLMIVTLISVMDNITDDCLEAAQSLGANFFKVFFRVIIPLSSSGIVVGSVLVFTGVISAYTTPSLLGGNTNMMLTTLLNQQVSGLSNWSKASSIAFIMIMISILLMVFMNSIETRLDKRGGKNEKA
ncbi:MAG: ABC transporter permease [Tissierellia bacterium]|nr:ABC transporter permease [Tissierellia bacterium]